MSYWQFFFNQIIFAIIMVNVDVLKKSIKVFQIKLFWFLADVFRKASTNIVVRFLKIKNFFKRKPK